MKKIGFIDYFLDEWHAEKYPAWIRESACEQAFEVRYAWGEIEQPGKRSNAAWCDAHGIELLGSIDEVIERSDALIVLSPDNPERHEDLAAAVLASGKPSYIDKTFAPDLAAARRMLARAAHYQTPMFSTSALRFAAEVEEAGNTIARENLAFVATGGGGEFATYAIHQAEMLIAITGRAARRVKRLGTPLAPLVMVDFGGEVYGSLQLILNAPFRLSTISKDQQTYHAPQLLRGFFPRFIDRMLKFFTNAEPPFPSWQTEAVIALLDAARSGEVRHDEWIPVEEVRGL